MAADYAHRRPKRKTRRYNRRRGAARLNRLLVWSATGILMLALAGSAGPRCQAQSDTRLRPQGDNDGKPFVSQEGSG